MALLLADKVTLARLVLAPLAVAFYLLLPIENYLCFWGCGLTCALAEYTDLADGQIARRRNQVTDFGKLADPFCDVFYRMMVFMALLLPAGGTGYILTGPPHERELLSSFVSMPLVRQSVFAVSEGNFAGAGTVPFLPVLLMVLREIVAGALRAMTGSKGLVLAARGSGKFKAWLQGLTLGSTMALPAFTMHMAPWHLTYACWATWTCAVVSLGSMAEYIWVNRAVLKQLTLPRAA